MLADNEDGYWFRRNVEVLAIPFMDKDGVEEGDQGKNRKPRDHNRDYIGQSVHHPWPPCGRSCRTGPTAS